MSSNINMDTTNPLHHHQQHQNWLGFSLSNTSSSPHHHHHHHHDSATSHSHHLSLFEAFTSSSTSSSTPGSAVDVSREEDPHHHHATTAGGATTVDLSMFGSGGGVRKLEDFLGGGGGATAQQQPQLSHFPVEVATTVVSIPEVAEYDSELKTIAASFLRGFSSSDDQQKQPQQQQQQQQQLVVAPPPSDLNPKKTLDTFGQRTSIYRGVTRHRWTGRYEAHLWDNSCRREGQSRKGRQGGYDKEDKAARAYDLAALKYWGPTTTTNFPISNYEKELEEMKHMTRQEFVASLRRKSSGFSRGASIYRGVTRHHQHGRWQARIGRVAGNKDLYLGTFSTQEEAAEAYDIAAIKFRGPNAVTNFDMSRYDVKSIMNRNLPIGGMSGKSKNGSDTTSDSRSGSRSDELDPSSASSLTFTSQPPSSTLSFAIPIKQDTSSDCWSNIFGYQQTGQTTLNQTQIPSLNNSKNENPPPAHNITTPASSGLFLNVPSAISSYGMDFVIGQGGSPNPSHSGLFLFNGGYNNFHHQQSENSPASVPPLIPFATPIALNCNNNNTNNAASNSGSSWNSGNGTSIAPSLHSIQAAKPNLSMFQTPIFGME
ncbi:hypothetical protein CDL15_Pgr016049 [Punica granatum]|uniref:AP2/ERF domain-containing protein n=1 Tax=Punica granatum TaxID=22663 RepID=A0A218XRY0_PUNGR|nr:hypothetical protein CDL15_Pgr016049 [Punica granatum]PKI46396.1 hypothetical protein CRG98_033234 [Punica granatum]